MKKISGIQVLRAIAAILVSTYHIDFIFNLGLNTVIGVDIFFVISGFIIMYTTQDNIDYFISKRVIKIIPLFWLLTLLTFISSKLIDGIIPYNPTFIDLIKSLFFIPFYRSSIRGGNAIRPLVGPAHTLLFEVFFYFIFYVSSKISHKNRGNISILIMTVLIIVGKFNDFSESAILIVWTNKFLLEFILGITLFYLFKVIQNKISFNRIQELFLISVSILLILCLVINIFDIFIINAFIVMIIVFIYLICFNIVKPPKLLIEIGNLSYSYFLIHYYVILIFNKFIYPLNKLEIKSILVAIIAIFFSLLISKASYELIEIKLCNCLKKNIIKNGERNILK